MFLRSTHLQSLNLGSLPFIRTRFLRPHRSLFIVSTTFPASKEATREAPTPLLLLSLSKEGHDIGENFQDVAKNMSVAGYSSLVMSLKVESNDSWSSLREMLASCCQAIKRTISSDPSYAMFPPIIIASDNATLPAQAYIESNPASGLCLIEPNNTRIPPDLSSNFDIKPNTPSFQFTYETRFPLLVLNRDAEPISEDSLAERWADEESGWIENWSLSNMNGVSSDAANKADLICAWLDQYGH